MSDEFVAIGRRISGRLGFTACSDWRDGVAWTFCRDDASRGLLIGWENRERRTDVLAPVIADGNATYTPGVSERRSGATTYLHGGLKSVETQTTPAQTVAASKTYDAFGAELSSTGTWSGPSGYGGGFGYREDASQFKLLGHRLYDAVAGRFLSRDPIRDGRNWYAYCDGDPVNAVDPDGLSWFKIAFIAAMRLIDLLGGGGPDDNRPGSINGQATKPEIKHPSRPPVPSGGSGPPPPRPVNPLPPPSSDGTITVPSLGGEAGAFRIAGVATTVVVAAEVAGEGIKETVIYRRRIQSYVDAANDPENDNADHWEH